MEQSLCVTERQSSSGSQSFSKNEVSAFGVWNTEIYILEKLYTLVINLSFRILGKPTEVNGWPTVLTEAVEIFLIKLWLILLCLSGPQALQLLFFHTLQQTDLILMFCWSCILVQSVPLTTEPVNSLIILPLMRILQQNLKWTYLIV